MRATVADRMKGQELDKVKREIKMAQLIKDKQQRQKEMMDVTTSSGKGNFASNGDSKTEKWQKCVDKANIMMKTIDKKAYS